MGILSILKVVFSKAISFLLFVIILICLNVFIPLFNNPVFTDVVGFLNASIMIIFWATLFILLGAVFYELSFPMNLPAPLLNAVGSLFIVTFIIRLLFFITQVSKGSVVLNLDNVYGIIYLCVFLVVLLAGYVDIFQNMPEGGFARRSRIFEKRPQEERSPKPTRKSRRRAKH